MSVRDYAADITVFIYCEDIELGSRLKIPVASAGYQTYFFSDMKLLSDRIAQVNPQLVVFQTASVKMGLSDFVQRILQVNPDTSFIPLAQSHQFSILSQYNEYGFVDILSDQPEAIGERLLWATDRWAERMLLSLQNKKLLETLQSEKSNLSQKNKEVDSLKSQPPKIVYPIAERLRSLRMSESPEALIQGYLNQFHHLKVIYLRSLPSIHSFVALSGINLGGISLNGLGFNLPPEDRNDFSARLALGAMPAILEQFIQKNFAIKRPRVQGLIVQGQVHGIFVFDQQSSTTDELEFIDGFKVMALVFENLHLMKKIEELEVQDSLTGLYVKSFYDRKMNEEFERAKRAQQPLSLLKISLDDFIEIEQSLGEALRDQILQLIAKEMNSNGRKHDLACRTGPNEFALILPICDRSGAMVRAERLRRSIEVSNAASGGVKISVSIGMSEYPGLCSSAEALDKTANAALNHISGKGGNRLCVWKAESGHKPDFVVQLPGASKP